MAIVSKRRKTILISYPSSSRFLAYEYND
jgi:hypothetical protein